MIAWILQIAPALLKYRLWMAFGILACAIPVSYGWGYWSGYSKARINIQTASAGRAINVREEINQVRNRRPDDTQLIDSLQSGTF